MITNDRSSKGIGSNKADYDENVEDYDTPPFTQRKRVCHVVHSDDDDSLAGRTVTGTWQGTVKTETGDGFGEFIQVAESKPTSHDSGKQTPTVKSTRPKMADYPLPDRQVIGTAIEFYHALLLTENPFPEPREEIIWVREAFEASCIYNKLPHIELDPGKIKIVRVDLGGMQITYSRLDHCTGLKPTGAIQISSKVIRCLGIRVPSRRCGGHQGEKPELSNSAEVQIGIYLPRKY